MYILLCIDRYSSYNKGLSLLYIITVQIMGGKCSLTSFSLCNFITQHQKPFTASHFSNTNIILLEYDTIPYLIKIRFNGISIMDE